MLISLKWLSEYVPAHPCRPKELAERLTLAGVKVEKHPSRRATTGTASASPTSSKSTRTPTPTASRLVTVTRHRRRRAAHRRLRRAQRGGRAEDRLRARSARACATATPARWTTLKAAKIRGVESTGMVCSEKELGLSEAHEGILELPDRCAGRRAARATTSATRSSTSR